MMKMCVVGVLYKKSQNKTHAKCSIRKRRWYADLAEISTESVNGNYYVLEIIYSNTNVLHQQLIPVKSIYGQLLKWIMSVIVPPGASTYLQSVELISDWGNDFRTW